MKINLYVLYDKENKKAGELFTAINDEQAKERLKRTIGHLAERGYLTKEQLLQTLTILNIGAYNTDVIENKGINGYKEYDSVIVVDEVYDIQDIPEDFIPRTSQLDEDEKTLYELAREQLSKNNGGTR